MKYVKPLLKDGMKVLEIGPDNFPSTYQRLLKDVSVACWDTLNICRNPDLTFQSSHEYDFQAQPDSYDIVLSGQVIEHVRKP